MKKINVAVIMGGPSVERDVSLNSGGQVLSHLNPSKYDAFPVEISKDGRWLVGVEKTPLFMPWSHSTERLLNETDAALAIEKTLGREAVSRPDAEKAANLIKNADVAYLALHGAVGEDGCLQGLFETINFPYTGSGVLASALAMDKIRAKQIFQQWGIPTPKSLVYSDADFEKHCNNIFDEVENWIGFPCVVKSSSLGSSVGVSICKTKLDLKASFEKSFYYGPQVLIEEFIKGVEVTCGVLDRTEGRAPIALPVTEISCPEETFFDYKIKYTKGAAREITPARLDSDTTKLVQDQALKVHKSIGCFGMSRTDMIIKDGVAFVLETNTLPGMTQTSLLPQGAAAMGMNYPELLDNIIETALERHQTKLKYSKRI